MDFELITYDKSDGIATITLNRPDRMNAFTAQMIEEWYAALLDANADRGTKAVIGANDHFREGPGLPAGRVVRRRVFGRVPAASGPLPRRGCWVGARSAANAMRRTRGRRPRGQTASELSGCDQVCG